MSFADSVRRGSTIPKNELGFEAETLSIDVDRLLLTAELANSMGEAWRKRSEKAVITEPRYALVANRITLTVRLGKRVKLVTVT